MIQISLFSRSIPMLSILLFACATFGSKSKSGESIKAEESQEGSTDIELPKNGSNI